MFQPFQHSTYSSGVIFVSVLNLPRRERNSSENVFLVGVIPGPREPKKNMNSYLKPLVDELQELWQGVIRAALICTACDIPASRKVSGFVGHNAHRACSRCLKGFRKEGAFGDQPDFTGTDRDNWPMRCVTSHRQHARLHKAAKTLEEQKTIERNHGCRYSVLIELPYYDVINYCVIDPMHNLLLGTCPKKHTCMTCLAAAKHVMQVWVQTGVLDKSQYAAIQERVDAFVAPTNIGRIPSKITSGFAGFTAEQWRNWAPIRESNTFTLSPSDYTTRAG